MADEPVGFDREWTKTAGRRARQRLGYSHTRGEVTRFLVQLEYWLEGEWVPIVRYDHDIEGEMAHDVTEEGLHIDIYREGTKYATEYITGPIPAGVALDLAEDHLSQNAERFLRRFEAWHTE